MSLLHPTPGEIIDRLTILELKIRAFKKSQRDSSSLELEERELENHFFWKMSKHPSPSGTCQLEVELDDVHRKLWDAENSIRSNREDTVQHIAIVAKRIAYLNDERNRLIREIDKAYGIENPVEEKIYTCTPPRS